MAPSIKAYFQDVHEEKIFDAVSDYIQDHTGELRQKFRRLHCMGEIYLDMVEVMIVYTERCKDNILNFEIATQATVVGNEGDYHYDGSRVVTEWYSVFGTGSLDALLQDFRVTGVTTFIKGRRRSSKTLKNTFVPNITKENLEAVAEQFLRDYYPEALRWPMAINTDVLLRKLKLKKVERRISEDASVFGRIYFEAADADFYNEETDCLETIHAESGTMFVDPMVFFLRTLGSLKNTTIHECVHWVFHRPVFVLEKINDNSLAQLDCAVFGGVRGRNWSVATQIEWQANALAPRIQMPAKTFKRKADELIDRLMETPL